MLPELRTVDELGAELWPTWDERRRRRWLYRQHEEHGMPAIKLGRSIVFDLVAVKAWHDARTTTRNGGDNGPSNGGAPSSDAPPQTIT